MLIAQSNSRICIPYICIPSVQCTPGKGVLVFDFDSFGTREHSRPSYRSLQPRVSGSALCSKPFPVFDSQSVTNTVVFEIQRTTAWSRNSVDTTATFGTDRAYGIAIAYIPVLTSRKPSTRKHSFSTISTRNAFSCIDFGVYGAARLLMTLGGFPWTGELPAPRNQMH